MSEQKTKPTTQSVNDFIQSLPEEKREQTSALVTIFEKSTQEIAVMWGEHIIGFGSYIIKSGKKESSWPLVSFSPRKGAFTLYGLLSAAGNRDLLTSLGKQKVSGSCLHITDLSQVSEEILGKIIKNAYTQGKTRD